MSSRGEYWTTTRVLVTTGAACFLAIVLLAPLRILSGSICGLNGDAAAAWVQAIGSIGALGIAIWLPWRDRQLAAEEARASLIASRVSWWTALAVIAGDACELVTHARLAALNEVDAVAFDQDFVNDIRARLRALDTTVPGAEGLQMLTRVRESIAWTMTAYRTALQDPSEQSKIDIFLDVHRTADDVETDARKHLDVAILNAAHVHRSS